MSRDIRRHVRFDPETGRPLPAETDFAALAAELVESAKGQGIELTGPNGLLTGLTRQVPQRALEVELSDHLGYDKHDVVRRNGDNSRKGSTPKTVRTEIGEITVRVPRDRDGTFQPAIVPKYQRRIDGFDEAVAKGMTTGDIQAHLADVFGQDISRELVSKVTDRVLDDMQAWQARPLDSIYPVILILPTPPWLRPRSGRYRSGGRLSSTHPSPSSTPVGTCSGSDE
jgi:putative transposase